MVKAAQKKRLTAIYSYKGDLHSLISTNDPDLQESLWLFGFQPVSKSKDSFKDYQVPALMIRRMLLTYFSVRSYRTSLARNR